MALPSDESRDWAESLWLAADAYDLGGRPDMAIRHFHEYLASRSVDDPRRPAVTYRLARAYESERQFESAVKFYQQTVDEHPRSTDASRSYVPLARCLVQLDRAPEAKNVLKQVVSGNRILAPEAVDYRDALVSLGTILYEEGEYVEAIERLSEAAERYPDHPRRGELLFNLADSYRAAARELQTQLEEDATMSPGERQRLVTLRREHLTRAGSLFDEVTDYYAQADVGTLDAARLQLQRLAYLHRGGCAFDLGDYETAIELFDHAARVYNTHHASLYALIQIVNCYAAMGDADRAATAHQRAKARLQQLPDETFDDTSALMDRAAWERWLENNPPGQTTTASAAAANPTS
jgi:tetratricopeptide (TPR) repeat protein